MYGGPDPMGTMGSQGPPPPSMPLLPSPVAPGAPVRPLMDPSTNNQPLQFNTSKGKPPMPKDVMQENHEREENGSSDAFSAGPDMNPTITGPMQGPSMGPMGPIQGQMQGPMQGPLQGPIQGPMQGPWGPMMGPNMMGMDPNMMGYAQYGYMGPMGPMDGAPVPKEIITLKSCTLHPPPPNAPPPTTRERPPGCRTIFVGGLPELMTEEVLGEIFGNFGVICSRRMSKRNFAHIRYELEESVEAALYLSGYRVKLEDLDDKEHTGRIHVDYAQARDDLHDWECKQRMLAREERHRMRIEEARLRPPSPPPVVHYSDHEATVLIEDLKTNDESFLNAAETLVTWLERGDCNRRSSNNFYIMLQSVNSHIRRLLTEKQQHDEELENVKIQFNIRLETIIRQFEQIEKVFAATSKQKAWDHFSKAQRKNIDTWRKQAKEVSKTQREDFLKGRDEAEMEMSDSEEQQQLQQPQETAPKRKKYMDPAEYAHAAMLEWQSTQLKDENEALKCQVEAYKNEVEVLKHETSSTDDSKDKQIKGLRQALQGMQQQLIQAKQEKKSHEETIEKLESRLSTSVEPQTERVTVVVVDNDLEEGGQTEEDVITKGVVGASANGAQSSGALTTTLVEEFVEDSTGAESTGSGLGSTASLPDKEARILAVLSTFLHVHPFGASIDYIWSYLQKLEIRIRSGELEDLMEKYPLLFKLQIQGVGASIEKRWKFIGFDPEQRNIIYI